LPTPRAPLALIAPHHWGINQVNPSSNEIQELKALCKNMANQITLLSRQSNARRYPYPTLDKAQNQHVLVENTNQAFSSR